MLEAANLSFTIDSSQAVTGAQALDRLTAAATATTGSTKALSEQSVEAQRAVMQLAQQAQQLGVALGQQSSGIDQLTQRVQLLSREVGLFRSTTQELTTALGQLNAAAQLFGTTAGGLDAFARSARNIGLTSGEMVQGLQRISQALEGITLAGQRARGVLETYGVRMEGRGPGDEAAVLREYVQQRRMFAPDARRNEEDFAVLGSLSIESMAAIVNPRYRTIEQQRRSTDEGETQRRLLEQRSYTAQRGMDLQRRADEYDDLVANYRSFGERFGFNASRAELERRRASGVAPRSEAWTFAPQADGTYALRDDPRRFFGENFDPLDNVLSPFRWLGAQGRWLTEDPFWANQQSITQRFRERQQESREAEGFFNSWGIWLGGLNEMAMDRTRNTFRNYVPPRAAPLALNDRTDQFTTLTSLLERRNGIDPLEQQIQPLLIQAARSFGNIDVTGWEGLGLNEILGRFRTDVGPNDTDRISQRAAVEARLRTLDQGVLTTNERERRDRDLLRRAGTTGLTADDLRFGDVVLTQDQLGLGDPMSSGEAAQRAQAIAQAIIRLRRTVLSEEERARELQRVSEELDRDRDAGVQQRLGVMNRQIALTERTRGLMTDADPRNRLSNTYEITRERALAEGATVQEANTRALMALTDAVISLERITNEMLQQSQNEVQRAYGGLEFLTTGRFNFSGIAGPGATDVGGLVGRAEEGAGRGPRGYRNNNPLNIIDAPFTRQQQGYVGSDGRFARFESMDDGIAAADRLLVSYARRGLTTVEGIVNRWAPAGDGNNNPSAYAAHVRGALGVSPGATLPMSDEDFRRRLIEAMAQVENGRPIPRRAAPGSGSGGAGGLSWADEEPDSFAGGRGGLRSGGQDAGIPLTEEQLDAAYRAGLDRGVRGLNVGRGRGSVLPPARYPEEPIAPARTSATWLSGLEESAGLAPGISGWWDVNLGAGSGLNQMRVPWNAPRRAAPARTGGGYTPTPGLVPGGGAGGGIAVSGGAGVNFGGMSQDALRTTLAAQQTGLAAYNVVSGQIAQGFDPSQASEQLARVLEGDAVRALQGFVIQLNRAELAHRDSLQVLAARTQGERELIQAQQQAATQAAQIRVQAQNIRDPAVRANALAMADQLERDAPRRAREAQAARTTADQDLQERDLGDARELGARWYMTNAERARFAAERAGRRRVEDTVAPGTEGRDGMIERGGRLAGASAELRELERQNQLVRDSFLDMSSAATSALSQIILRGGDARQVMRALLADIASMALRRATTGLGEQVFSWIGQALSGLGGGSITPSIDEMASPGFFSRFAQGGFVTPMASGDIVHAPFYKPMAGGGTALIGEAGSEAVLPLRRDANGNLGVVSAGGRDGGHTINITVNGGGRGGGGGTDREQANLIAETVTRALDERQKANILNEQRVGGMLNPHFQSG